VSTALETKYEAVIGLEVHVELSTRSKMFCGCATAFGADPNTQTCPVCLGQPGSLPVPNKAAIESLMQIGLALGCSIAPRSLFHRKNYFYPDMPKNYQISQFDLPLCVDGFLEVDVESETVRIGIERAHMEEDTGKSLHVGRTGRIADATHSLVDYNRAGIPLVEIVSRPDVRSAAAAKAYLTELRSIVETLGVSDARMEEGSMRCDANISIRPRGSTELGTKVEIKNLNSIRSLGRAITAEIERQTQMAERGERIIQETRHFDEQTGLTSTMRVKEGATDYRYFPEPDLVPIVTDEAWISGLRERIPELPKARRERLIAEHQLTKEQLSVVAASPVSVAYFDELLARGVPPRDAAVWMTGELSRALNTAGHDISDSVVDAPAMAELIAAVKDGTVNLNTAKRVFARAYAEAKPPMQIINDEGLAQVSDDGAIGEAIAQVLAGLADDVARFRAGEEKVFGFLMGQVMRALKGQGAPEVVQRILREQLAE
jgi:aspartyl-tRNA(Asn)/glutamyl-tRNA(Gln) amidotransferase subunit B